MTPDSDAKPVVTAKETQLLQKRKATTKHLKGAPYFSEFVRKHYRDEQCYAVIHTSCGSGKLPEDHLKTVEYQVKKKILEYIRQGGNTVKLTNCELKAEGVREEEVSGLTQSSRHNKCSK